MGDDQQVLNPKDCPECQAHFFGSPYLVEAAASIGIERGLSTGEMLRRYLTQHHGLGHPERKVGEE